MEISAARSPSPPLRLPASAETAPPGSGCTGLSDTGFGVAGGAGSGVGVQGYAGATGIAVQAVNLDGGTALEVHNGALRVAGAVRTAFVHTNPIRSICSPIDHPLLNNDPTAMLFATNRTGRETGAVYNTGTNRWLVCTGGAPVEPGESFNVLVIKQ